MEDFNWLLYYIRAINYTSTQLMHRGVCTNPKHLAAVAAKEKPLESLETISILNKTNLKEKVLDVDKVNAYIKDTDFTFLTDAGWCLHVSTMQDLVDMEEDFSDLPNAAEIEYLADFACIKRIDGSPSSLRDKILFIEQQSPDNLMKLAMYKNLVADHGVDESIKFNCKECGAEVETTVSITAHSFL